MRNLLVIFIFVFGVIAFAEADVAVVAEKSEVVAATVEKAIEAPEEVGDIVGFLPALVGAYKNGAWTLFGALIALILTFVIRKFVLPVVKLGSGVLPLVSAILGIVAGVGLAVANGASAQAASMAVLSGPLASTLWDSLIKYFFKKK